MPTSLDDVSTFGALVRRTGTALPRSSCSGASRPVLVVLAGLASFALAPSRAATTSAFDITDVSSATERTMPGSTGQSAGEAAGEPAPALPDASATRLADAFGHSAARFADEVVLPAHAALGSATARLREAAAAFERTPDTSTLDAFRRERERSATALAAGRAFAFGPLHSLGLDVALDFPIDETGIALTLEGLARASTVDLDEGWRPSPSLTGLGAIDHLLGASEDPDDFTAPARRYLHALARRVDASAVRLIAAWEDGPADHPAYSTVLATAGAPGHPTYRSVENGAEEIVRGLIGTLDIVVQEELPALIEGRDALARGVGRHDLAMLDATIAGVSTAYRGAEIERWFEADDRTTDTTIRHALEEASAAVASSVSAVGNPAVAGPALRLASISLEWAKTLLEERALSRTRLPSGASAGAATAFDHTSSAYEAAPPNLSARGMADHDLGDEAFEESFVQSADHASAGLGPTFNNTSCVACHVRNGRGMPVPGQLLLRVSDTRPGGADALEDESETLAVRGRTPPVAGLGNQIQDFGVAGVAPEARVDITWRETAGAYPDGSPYRLRSPVFEVVLASTGEPLPASVRVSPRVPPHVYGLGLLEAVSEADILALADPDDRDGDGISGRPNQVWNEQLGAYSLGRFGWKANSPNLLQQTADAYLNDMGVHSPLFPAEDGSSEIDAATLKAATAYSQTLAVPARRSLDDADTRRGEALFADVGCSGCHVDTLRTGEHEYPALVDQVIHPYTDLLLHDMGEGLADGRPDFEASGREWRTSSLWGIGLAQTVLPYSGYLHDGRARTLEEAILWHGGEADGARSRFEHLPAPDRRAMVSFLGSL